jgi:plastocyanin
MKPFVVLATLAVLTAAVAATAEAQVTRLQAEVGPGYAISVKDVSGNPIRTLPAGSYELVVSDRSEEHNFHLTGPGVDVSTEVEFVGEKTFSITVTDGIYRFVCDPHADRMRGSFDVGVGAGGDSGDGYAGGSGGSSGSGGGTAPAKPSVPVGSRLALTVGPGFTITLRSGGGQAIRRLAPGGYTVVARDRSDLHNAHLTGSGVNRKTTVPFVGTTTWKISIRAGTLRFVCDPHKQAMKGSVVVSR